MLLASFLWREGKRNERKSKSCNLLVKIAKKLSPFDGALLPLLLRAHYHLGVSSALCVSEEGQETKVQYVGHHIMSRGSS